MILDGSKEVAEACIHITIYPSLKCIGSTLRGLVEYTCIPWVPQNSSKTATNTSFQAQLILAWFWIIKIISQ